MLATILIFICIGLSCYLISYFNTQVPQKAQKSDIDAFKSLLTKGYGYEYYHDGTGYAINVQANKIALYDNTIYEYDVQKLKKIGYEWVTPGSVGRTKFYGEGLQTATRQISTNMREALDDRKLKLQAYEESGIFVSLSDIDHPTHQIRFIDENELRRSFEIISQFMDGTLLDYDSYLTNRIEAINSDTELYRALVTESRQRNGLCLTCGTQLGTENDISNNICKQCKTEADEIESARRQKSRRLTLGVAIAGFICASLAILVPIANNWWDDYKLTPEQRAKQQADQLRRGKSERDMLATKVFVIVKSNFSDKSITDIAGNKLNIPIPAGTRACIVGKSGDLDLTVFMPSLLESKGAYADIRFSDLTAIPGSAFWEDRLTPGRDDLVLCTKVTVRMWSPANKKLADEDIIPGTRVKVNPAQKPDPNQREVAMNFVSDSRKGDQFSLYREQIVPIQAWPKDKLR